MDFADFWLASPQITPKFAHHACRLHVCQSIHNWSRLVIIGHAAKIDQLWPCGHLKLVTKLAQPWTVEANIAIFMRQLKIMLFLKRITKKFVDVSVTSIWYQQLMSIWYPQFTLQRLSFVTFGWGSVNLMVGILLSNAKGIYHNECT